jgi:uncharacterized BrkB/YihY/UPF0761 family membrane protein
MLHVALNFLLFTIPAWAILRFVPKREPWQVLRVAAWTWITIFGFIAVNQLLQLLQRGTG